MSRKVVLLLVGVFCMVAVTRADFESNDWLAYKAKYGKSYESRVEESMRHSIFTRNKQRIEQHNRDASSSFKMGLNHLSDRTEAELQRSRGFKLPENHVVMMNSEEGVQYLSGLLDKDSSPEPIPKEVDWRKEQGRVTGVKDQGSCGSCWAFSTTGLLEGQMVKASKAKELISLSEQNLVDCVVEHGCQGSWPTQALFKIFEEGGINSEKSYPYGGVEHKCRFNETASVMQTRGPIVLPQDEEILKAVVAKYGPVSVAIDAEGLDSYESGVYSNNYCGKEISRLDHAVLLVGYGTDPKQGDYWLVKNSWGEYWGEKGYGRMARNKDNMCGIATMAVIAAFDKYVA